MMDLIAFRHWISSTACAFYQHVGIQKRPGVRPPERRRAARFLDGAETVVTHFVDDEMRTANARIVDLTEKGLRLWCDAKLRVGEIARCNLPLANQVSVAHFQIVWRNRCERGYEYGVLLPQVGLSRAALRDYVLFVLSGRQAVAGRRFPALSRAV